MRLQPLPVAPVAAAGTARSSPLVTSISVSVGHPARHRAVAVGHLVTVHAPGEEKPRTRTNRWPCRYDWALRSGGSPVEQ